MGLGYFICCNLSRIIGPYDQTFIETSFGKGTTFSFYIYKNLTKDLKRQDIIVQSHILIPPDNNLEIPEE